MYGEFSRPELSIAPVLVGATRRPRILGWCRGNFTFPHQPKEWAQYVSEATAQYCRLQSWRAEQAQVTDEDGSSLAAENSRRSVVAPEARTCSQ